MVSGEGHLSFLRTWWMVGVGGTRSLDEQEPEQSQELGLFFLKLLAVVGTRFALTLPEGRASNNSLAFR